MIIHMKLHVLFSRYYCNQLYRKGSWNMFVKISHIQSVRNWLHVVWKPTSIYTYHCSLSILFLIYATMFHDCHLLHVHKSRYNYHITSTSFKIIRCCSIIGNTYFRMTSSVNRCPPGNEKYLV